MLINVPQYIDVEDKIVGPLTGKQLGWILVLGVLLMVLWNMVPGPVFFILGLPLTVLFVALAFYRPYGQPLGSFVIFGVMYFFRPKIYVWKRSPMQEVKNAPQKIKTVEDIIPDKHISSQSLRELAGLLDSEGQNSNTELEKILKNVPIRK